MTEPQYDFTYLALTGVSAKADLLGLLTVVDGPLDMGDGWSGDGINYVPSARIFIEFQSAVERVPGFSPSRSREVTREYVVQAYGVAEEALDAFTDAAHGPDKAFKPMPLRGSP